MGVDFKAQMNLGVIVTREDFWQRTGNKNPARCPQGHDIGKDMYFCPTCGQRLPEVIEEVPTPLLKAIMRQDKWAWDSDPESYYRGLFGDDEFGLFPLSNHQGEEGTEASGKILLGTLISSIGSREGNGGALRTFNKLDLDNLFAFVQERLEKLGLGDREIQLLPVLYVSY